MHNAPLSFLINLLYLKKLIKLLNRCELDPCEYELDPCVYEVFDSESALELNPVVVTLTPGDTLYICPFRSSYPLCFCHFSFTVQTYRLYVYMFYSLLYLHYTISPPSSAEVKSESCFTSSPPLCLNGLGRDILPFFLPMCTAHRAFNSFAVFYLSVMSHLFYHLLKS